MVVILLLVVIAIMLFGAVAVKDAATRIGVIVCILGIGLFVLVAALPKDGTNHDGWTFAVMMIVGVGVIGAVKATRRG